MRKYLLIPALILILTNCKPKEIIKYRDRVVNDTVRVKVEKVVTQPGRVVTEVKEICPDSVEARPFKKIITRGEGKDQDTIIVEVVKDGTLLIDIREKTKVIKNLEERYERLETTLKETEKTVLIKKDLTGYLILLILLVVGYFVGGANGLIKRFLKFL